MNVTLSFFLFFFGNALFVAANIAVGNLLVLLPRTSGKRFSSAGSTSPFTSEAKRRRLDSSPPILSTEKNDRPSKSPSPSPSHSPSWSSSSVPGGFSMSRSNSADSFDVTSAKVRADGPARIRNARADPLAIGKGERTTIKTWNKRVSSIRASTSPGSHDTDNPPVLDSILKGKKVHATVDTTRGGSGYINLRYNDKSSHFEVSPGQKVEVQGLQREQGRAMVKTKLYGAGVINSAADNRSGSPSSEGQGDQEE